MHMNSTIDANTLMKIDSKYDNTKKKTAKRNNIWSAYLHNMPMHKYIEVMLLKYLNIFQRAFFRFFSKNKIQLLLRCTLQVHKDYTKHIFFPQTKHPQKKTNSNIRTQTTTHGKIWEINTIRSPTWCTWGIFTMSCYFYSMAIFNIWLVGGIGFFSASLSLSRSLVRCMTHAKY